jgi:hypothetical protein
MRLIQLKHGSGRAVAMVEDGGPLKVLGGVTTMRELAQRAIAAGTGLDAAAAALPVAARRDYAEALSAGALLAPLDHQDPAHCIVTGTGLTHLGSASARDEMHKKAARADGSETDSLKMFNMGLKSGRPTGPGPGVQPEWFYKGDGGWLMAPEADLPSPDFALDGGEEPEIAGLYLIAPDGRPLRLGFALGNEFSDHVTEKQNYLYLAHSKLRVCATGPELRTGALPRDLKGESRIRRGGEVIWKKPFLTGEDNMSHTIANLEYHHFKYAQFRRPGDVHIHFFGTSTLSVADGVKTRPGDVFEIEMAEFGRPLRNRLAVSPHSFTYGGVKAL